LHALKEDYKVLQYITKTGTKIVFKVVLINHKKLALTK